MLNPKDINKLDDYSYNRSSLEQKKELEQRMQENPEFKEESNVFFRLFRGFKALEVEEFQNNMNQWEKKHQQSATSSTNTKVIKISSYFKYVAAAILILAMMPLGYQYMNSSMTADEMFAANFEHNKAFNYFHSRAVNMDTDKEVKLTEEEKAAELEQSAIAQVLDKGIHAYNDHDYAAAKKYFSAYMTATNTEDKDEVEFFLAVSYLAEGQTAEAKPLFEKMAKRGSKSRKADADWYLALTLLKENNVEDAKKILKKITKKKKAHPHKEKALNLQQQIDKYYVTQ